LKPCIYGDQTHPEGAIICVSGRELLCVAGEWAETGRACSPATGESDASEPNRTDVAARDDAATGKDRPA
jgi:hypothetical protein